MLQSIEIKNYKSIEDVTIALGRVNLFIGENGAGKSNILEACALAGAANAGKLDNEFLSARGVRVTQPQLMRAAFEKNSRILPIIVNITDLSGLTVVYHLQNDNSPYFKWHSRTQCYGKDLTEIFTFENIKKFIEIKGISRDKYIKDATVFLEAVRQLDEGGALEALHSGQKAKKNFVENDSKRNLQQQLNWKRKTSLLDC